MDKKTVAQLKNLGSTLHQETDQLNLDITAFEDAFRGIGVGVVGEVHLLGNKSLRWGKHDRKWKLYVVDNDGGEPQPLINCTRTDRLAAIAILPKLVQAITELTEREIVAVQAASEALQGVTASFAETKTPIVLAPAVLIDQNGREVKDHRVQIFPVFCQLWEESERGWGTRPDGFSLHQNKDDITEYTKRLRELEMVGQSANYVPDEYSRPDGEPYVCLVNEAVLERIMKAEFGDRFYASQPAPPAWDGKTNQPGWHPIPEAKS